LPLAVPVTEVKARPWRQTIDGFGHVVAAEKVMIGVETAGTVREIRVREGEQVNPGQVLLRLDDRKQRLRLERARADVVGLRAELERARGTYQRYQALMARQVVSEEAFKQTQAAAERASARLAEALAARALAQQELSDLTVHSPVSGVVEVEDVENGQKVQPGDVLVVLQSSGSLQVVTYVREEEVNLLRPGGSAPIHSPGVPGREYLGQIEAIASAADPKTGNFAVKLRVDNREGLLREGMSARVALRSALVEDTVVIPRSALIDRDRRRVLFVIDGGYARRVTPKLGLGSGEEVVVRAGLRPGDQLITGRLRLLVHNTPVQAVVDAALAAQTSF
jgi:membrane fusion protein (multidrug efflux system)